jgi:hypothetical protein
VTRNGSHGREPPAALPAPDSPKHALCVDHEHRYSSGRTWELGVEPASAGELYLESITPPSTGSTKPVMKSLVIRWMYAEATCSGVPSRCSGTS